MMLRILTEVTIGTSASPLSGVSLRLGQSGIAAMILGGICGMFPLWKSASLSPDSIQRRCYWTGFAAAVVLFFAAFLPDLKSALFVSVAAAIGMVSIAAMWTNHIKINGRVYAASAGNRRPDRPPALAGNDDTHP